MNTLVVCLVFLMAAESTVSKFTDFENGVVTGTLQQKDTKKCVKFGKTRSSPGNACVIPYRGFLDYCRENLAFLDTSSCATVGIDVNGLIRASGQCLHLYQTYLCRDIFMAPCGTWQNPEISDAKKLIYTAVQSNGQILFNNGRNCVTKHPSFNSLTSLSSKDAKCRASSSHFRIVATGTSWFASDSSTAASKVDTSANHCAYSNRRLCTAVEVCPTSPGGQSVAGVTGESLNKALLVEGGAFLDAATCKRLSRTSGYNVDGFLCCPSDDLPSPKNFVSDGYGYFMHKSGKCAHYVNQRLVLKTDCKSQTALLSWSSDGTIKQGTNCIVDQSLGQCPPFQFTNVNSLQDVFTSKCLVPKAGKLNPAEDTELVERAECGEAYASFVLKRIQGYLKHSSNKCVGVEDGMLVFQASCTSAEQVFYKESFSSGLVHVASGKCVADPGSDGTALNLTDCTSTGVATLTYDGTTFGYSGGKCVKPQGGGNSPADGEELVIQTGCSGPASTFHFAGGFSFYVSFVSCNVRDASFCGGKPCTCVEGYEKHGINCFPINNCETSNDGCQGNAECVYTGPGTSMCVCPPGYRLNSDGKNCDQCPNNNCYTQCQFVDDSELKSVIRLKAHVEIRFLNIKSSDLRAYIGDTTTKLVVFAHQITIAGTLTLPSGLAKVAIFANEILKENGGEIVLWNNAKRGRRAAVKVENGKLLCQNRYSDSSPNVKGTVLNIYTSDSSAPFSCSGNYNRRDLSIQAAIKSKQNPKKALDVELYSIMLNCAKVVSQGIPFAKKGKLLRGSLPVTLIRHVLDEVRAAKEERLDTSSVDALRLEAKNLMEDLSLRARGFYKVPYLSLKAHEKILVLIKDDAKMAIQKYELFERISQDFAAGIEATNSMTKLMSTIVRRNDLDLEALEKELEAARSDAQAMKAKFDDAVTELDTVREATFDAGVRDYSNQQIANAVFSVLGGITSIFGGGSGAFIGFTIELSSLAEDISKIQKTLFKISIIMDSISRIAEAATSFTNLHYDVLPYAGTSTSDYYSKSKPEKNDQSLAVMVKEWEVFEAEADAFLGVGTASEISGASDYLAALKTVAVWGKGYHEKSITVQELLARLTKLQTLKNEQHQAQANIQASRDTALTERKVNGELLLEMALQKQRLRNIMVEKLMSFCDSYFYNWLSECPVMPTMSDDLYALHEKVNQGLSAVINAVSNFAPFIPQEYETTIIITDDGNCSARRNPSTMAHRRHQLGKRSSGGANESTPNTLKCPISELKRTNSFVFKLDENDRDIFRGHERVHVDEFEIYFERVEFGPDETEKEITARISFTGIMTDVFRGTRYEFLSPPRVTEFSYQIKQDGSYKVIQSGKVSDKYEDYYDGIAALTTWSVDLPVELNNPSLNLAGVTRVKLKLKGTRVPVEPVQGGGDRDLGQDRRVVKNDEGKRRIGRKGRKRSKSF
ncbi:hypothetical protein ACROYT_G010476 [Oculina patagonica]